MPSTLSHLLYHVVFSTKDRKNLIARDLTPKLYAYLGGIVRSHGGFAMAIGSMPDHMHMLIQLKPSIALSDAMRHIKAGSSKWINEQNGNFFAWQAGYGAFSVSESQCQRVRKYIENQAIHHQRVSFEDELKLLLKKHNIEYDSKYLFD